MRRTMLFAGGLVVGFAVHAGLAQTASRNVVMMNHVAINVPNIPEAISYYTEKMGYREAFRVPDAMASLGSFTSTSAKIRSWN